MPARVTTAPTIPWAAWHGDELIPLDIPESWQCREFTMRDADPLSASEIDAALQHPVQSGSIAEICAGKQSVAIAVDDLSRPTPAAHILPALLREIEAAGISADRVVIVISLGAHTPLGKEQLRLKLGREATERCRVVNHDCRGDLVPCGASVGKTEVLLNRDFLQADVRILIGSVVPHHFAGFSGGAKMILPGLSNLDSIAWTHKAVLMGLRGKAGTLENNRFRQEFERVAREAGVDMSINVVVNSRREIAGLFAGDVVEAHRAGAAFARQTYATPVPERPFDAALFNCYPKDTELIQAENGFMYMHSAGDGLINETGTIILASACSEGTGRHGLFEPGEGLLYRKPVRKRFLGEKHVIFFSPGLDAARFHELYWEGYDFCASWAEVVERVRERHGQTPQFGVFPHASVQIAVENA